MACRSKHGFQHTSYRTTRHAPVMLTPSPPALMETSKASTASRFTRFPCSFRALKAWTISERAAAGVDPSIRHHAMSVDASRSSRTSKVPSVCVNTTQRSPLLFTSASSARHTWALPDARVDPAAWSVSTGAAQARNDPQKASASSNPFFLRALTRCWSRFDSSRSCRAAARDASRATTSGAAQASPVTTSSRGYPRRTGAPPRSDAYQ